MSKFKGASFSSESSRLTPSRMFEIGMKGCFTCSTWYFTSALNALSASTRSGASGRMRGTSPPLCWVCVVAAAFTPCVPILFGS